jgi:hypothetical protein
MTKNFKKFMVYTFTVLVSKLVYDVIMKLLPVIKSTHNPYFDVAIGMTLTLIIFYPFYGFTHKWMEKFSGHYVKHAKIIHRNNFIALVIAYVIGVLILFGCYMMLKFNINIVTEAYIKLKELVS